MRRLLGLLFVLAAAVAQAGDVARFANLGFSADDRYFSFAQYGVDDRTLNPYAEMYVVDVPANEFAADGVQKRSFDVNVQPGDTGLGALFSLLTSHTDLLRRYSVDHLKTGRLLYLYVNGEEPLETLSFRDFEGDASYSLQLVQQTYGSGKSIASSFYIDLRVTRASGETMRETVGLPGYRREGVTSYRIRQVLVSPGGESLVIVVEKTALDSGGNDIRFMVETVRLDP